MSEKLPPSMDKLNHAREQHCGAVLRKILFPFAAVNRTRNEAEVPVPLRKSKLVISIKGGVSLESAPDEGVYAVVAVSIGAQAKAADNDDELMSAAITCLGYFRCAKEFDIQTVDRYITDKADLVTRHWTEQIYAAAVVELQRLIHQAGLPPLNISLSPPNEMTAAKAKKPRKRTAAKKTVKAD